MSWRVLGDAAVFVGGIRALVIQSAHPEVVAGVEDHSSYRTDPLGRLSRTSVYVTETTYGAMPEVEAAVAVVSRAHRPVTGTSERGLAYSASRPEMAAWVHNVLTDSFLAAYQAFGPETLSTAEADRFVAEQTAIGKLLGAAPLPETAKDLTEWIVGHPDRQTTAAQTNAIGFLRNPPLSRPVRLAYRVLFDAALTTIPTELRSQLEVDPPSYAAKTGKTSTDALRWALGASPSWQLALVRCDAPIPKGVFRQPLPVQAGSLG
ncbi:MAG: oxygenase MpaB family protein [Acidimicrobiales bacterium]